jgi:hypothetical protein
MCCKTSLAIVAGALLWACASIVHAGTTTAVFDFENQPTSGAGLSTVMLANNGLSVTIDRAGQPFNIADLSALGGTSAFGARTLAPTPPGVNSFNLNFSQPVSSFSAQMGDFSSTLTDHLTMTAFSGLNGTGKNLGTSSSSLVLSDSSVLGFKTLGITGTGINSVQMIGGEAAGANSVFYDNLSATFTPGGNSSSVPLPAAAFVAPLAAVVAWLAARKLRPAAAT